ncbi:clumping factor B, partial [Staphylococcus argenteus]|nr:clumping factor B [Staphylococcus argenteus]
SVKSESPQTTAMQDQATAAKPQEQTVPQEVKSKVDKTTSEANSASTNSERKSPQKLDLPQSSPQTSASNNQSISNTQAVNTPSVRTRALRSLAAAEPVVNAADNKSTNVTDKVTASDFKLEKTTVDPNHSGNTF